MGKSKNIKILNLSAVDYGGAGKFASDFNLFFEYLGYETCLIVKDKKKNESNVLLYPDDSWEKLLGKGLRKISKLKRPQKFVDDDFYFYNWYETYTVVSAKKILSLIPYNPDVIFLHWVSDFINAKVINELKQLSDAKIYWLMIDNAPITGGCHYPWSCMGYERNCENCPAIIRPQNKSRAKYNLAFKRKFLPSDLCLITFSQSDYQRALVSSVFKDKSIYKWMAYVDEKRFEIGNITLAKRYFGLPDEKKIVFFGATSLKEKRKGMALLLKTIELIHSDDIVYLIAGHLDISLPQKNIKMVGTLNEENLIKAYQAADLFVCPSIEDSGPMMINQSLMCGTPVVAFATGVALDLVHNHQTGFRAPLGNCQELSKGIRNILELNPFDYQRMVQNCRDLAVSLYSTKSFRKQIDCLLEDFSNETKYDLSAK